MLISSAIKVAHDATTWHSEDLELVGMTGQSNCGIYVQFRVPNADYDSAYGAVSTASEVMDVLGPISTKNPVALGCYCAIAGGAGTVYFIGAVQDSIPAYQKALDYLDRYNNMYSIVPCTENQAVISACAGKVGEISDNIESKVWRTLWYGISCTARTNDGKITGTTLEDNAVNQVPELLKKRVTNTLRAQCVWADDAYINGESLDGSNYALAAAAAGMRAGQPCHRPLSNLGYSFFTIKEKHGFSRSQLKQLGANGIWIIANNEDGAPINMRQVTTAVANNLNEDEESIVANADNIAINMANIGRELVGCSNISPDLLLALEATIRARMDAKTVNTYGAYIGPQIISWELVKPPYQDPVNLDHVLAEFSITPPRPFNQLHMTLIVL